MKSRHLRRTTYTLLTILVVLVVGGFTVQSGLTGDRQRDGETLTDVVPVFLRTEDAKNPTSLSLIVDQQKVLGWITGEKSFAGQSVSVKSEGSSDTVIIQADNTFTWHYDVEKPADVQFCVGDLSLTERVEPYKTPTPSVFFVLDRTVCRPQQEIRFAGFLRSLDRSGDFVPVVDREVEVHLKSRSKSTVAAKLKLKSDGFGRITGAYEFSAADALDTYDLTIPEFVGNAEVKLAEFRKAKVKLKIDGKRDGDTLKLEFQAADFLDKPVPGSKLRFTAQVVRRAEERKEHALDANDFVYQDVPLLPVSAPEERTSDEYLLWEAGLTSRPLTSWSGQQVVAQLSGDVPVDESGRGEHTLELEPEWTTTGHDILVAGVLTDYNGREQRSTRKIAIGEEENSRASLDVQLPRRLVGCGDRLAVQVTARDASGKPLSADTSVVAMRLSANALAASGFDYSPWWNSNLLAVPHWQLRQNGRAYPHNLLYGHRRGRPVRRWNVIAQPTHSPIQREMVTAAVVKDGTATLSLHQPGPYKLVAVARLADGTTLTNEVGCVVRDHEDMPGLVLQLAKDTFVTGDSLDGVIHSRFENARVLLTLRDSSGTRMWKTLTIPGSMLAISERLPTGLRYGANVEVQYVDSDTDTHFANRFIRVEPRDRMLTVDAKVKEICEPGEKVTIDLSVNRREPVDLVVSVYDQSLLGVAPDSSKDIRNFYLADERSRWTAAREILRRRLAGVTVKELVERGEELLKEDPDLAKTPEGQLLQNSINHYRSNRYVNAQHLSTLLNLAGVPTAVDPYYTQYYGWNWYWHADPSQEEKSPARVFDILSHVRSQWQLSYWFAGDTLALAEFHPQYAQQQAFYLGRLGNGGLWQNHAYNLRSARGDAHYSVSANAFYSPTANGMFSQVSGQSFISHLPTAVTGAPVELIDADAPNVNVRRDFSDSAYFNAMVRTDDHGKARVTFKVPDSLTNWRVVVTAVSKKMHVGQVNTRFRTFKPVMVWPMVPRIFAEGDEVELYASVHNRTDKPQDIDVSLKVENGEILTPRESRVRVPAKGNIPVYWTFRPKEAGFTQILMTARCEAGSDASLKRLPVTGLVAEQSVTRSGFCKGVAEIEVPTEATLENSQLTIALVPSVADDMVQSLGYLVEYPHGCVEQTMSRFLPAIKVAQTLERARIADPELEQKLPGVVDAGIKRLLQLQQQDGGWGWHGGSQTHEMMTPYALYGLLEAEKAGYPIPNEGAIQRGLDRLAGFISSMGEKQTADRIYCMYVYKNRLELQDDWWQFIDGQLKKDKLSDYALALALEMAASDESGKRKELADSLATALARRAVRADDTAYWQTANFSRWGNDRFEITAAALKALVAYDPTHELVAPVLTFFARTKSGNRWNSTKATAMVIYAMCDYLAFQDHEPGVPRAVTVQVNDGKPQTVDVQMGDLPRIKIPGGAMHHGSNVIRFSGDAPGAMFRAVFRYWKKGRDIEPLAQGLSVKRQFFLLDDHGNQLRELVDRDTVPRGAYVQSVVTVNHKLGQSMRYVLVDNPKPANCEILPTTDERFSQQSTPFALREDKTRAVVYHHEQTSNTIVDRCVLHAELAGKYTVAPATVELMYETDVRGHSGTFCLTVSDDAD